MTHVCYYDLFSLHEWGKKWRGECKKTLHNVNYESWSVIDEI